MGPQQARQEGECLMALGAADGNGVQWDNRRDGNILDLDMYYNKQCSLYMK